MYSVKTDLDDSIVLTGLAKLYWPRQLSSPLNLPVCETLRDVSWARQPPRWPARIAPSTRIWRRTLERCRRLRSSSSRSRPRRHSPHVARPSWSRSNYRLSPLGTASGTPCRSCRNERVHPGPDTSAPRCTLLTDTVESLEISSGGGGIFIFKFFFF